MLTKKLARELDRKVGSLLAKRVARPALLLLNRRSTVSSDAGRGRRRIREELERIANEAAGNVEAQVFAASPLAQAQLERLRRALMARTERDVQLRVSIDPSLLGGVIAKVGDLVFDGSLRTQLVQLRANLMKGR